MDGNQEIIKDPKGTYYYVGEEEEEESHGD